MEVGDKVNHFTFNSTAKSNANLNDHLNEWLVLYFYPKDATPGCTLEGQDFGNNYLAFRDLNTQVFGISRDSLKSHDKFKCAQNFPFDLISDEDESICRQFAVIKPKLMYGKEVLGIERSTFIIDPKGYVRHIWRKVSVPGHVQEVLKKLQELQAM